MRLFCHSAGAKEVGYVPVGDSCPGWRGPIFKMKINCLRQNGLTLAALVLGWLCLSPGDARAFSLIGGPPAMNPVVGSAGRLLEGAGGAGGDDGGIEDMLNQHHTKKGKSEIDKRLISR